MTGGEHRRIGGSTFSKQSACAPKMPQLRALALGSYLLATALVGAQRGRLDTTSRIISAEIDLLMARPFESVLRTQRLTELGYAGWAGEAGDSEQARQMRQHLYAEMIYSGVGGPWTDAGGEWRWRDGKTMLYIGTERGRFLGYWEPQGEAAYVQRVPSGAANESLWEPHAGVAEASECVRSGQCQDSDASAGRVARAAGQCPVGTRPGPRH